MEIKDRRPKIVWTPYSVGTTTAAACGASNVTMSNALTGKIETYISRLDFYHNIFIPIV